MRSETEGVHERAECGGIGSATTPSQVVPDSDPYRRERLAPVVAEARNWTDLMRRLGLKPSGGQRRVLQEKVVSHGLDTHHFAKRSPWRKYPDAAIAEAAASSSSLREVALKLGATLATGTLSHIRRRISAAGIDISHFPGIDRSEPNLPIPLKNCGKQQPQPPACVAWHARWGSRTTAARERPWAACWRPRVSTSDTSHTGAHGFPRASCAVS